MLMFYNIKVKRKRKTKKGRIAHSVQVHGNMAVSIDNGTLTAQLDNLADNEDVAVDVAVEVRARNARGFHGGHFEGGCGERSVKVQNQEYSRKCVARGGIVVRDSNMSSRDDVVELGVNVCMEGQTRSTRCWEGETRSN